MKTIFKWSDGSSHSGEEETFDEAWLELLRYRPFYKVAYEVVVSNGLYTTSYFYPSEEEADKDEEGCYAPQIAEVEVEDYTFE